MSDRLEWVFPDNPAREIDGPNDGRIVHFKGDRARSVVREAVQNSLDAAASGEETVEVSLSLDELEPTLFGGASLREALQAAADSDDNDDAHQSLFRRGGELLAAGGPIPCLRISDRNTTGAADEGQVNRWRALTKGSGSSAKTDRDAAGSFGLGKFASFAASDLRTVVYSTAYRADDGSVHHLAQGKCVLVSHRTNGTDRRGTGYLGAAEFEPLRDGEIPKPLRRDDPGLSILVAGFSHGADWQDAASAVGIRNFFHALNHSRLGLTVGTTRICADNVTDIADELRGAKKLSGEDIRLLKVSRTDPVDETHIPGIGKVLLYIEVRPEDHHRDIALVRDAGMKIAGHAREMKPLGLGRIPVHWRGYTALVECLSGGETSLLRDAESPEHDRIQIDYIEDLERRRNAKFALGELGEWCRKRIREHAEPKEGRDSENLSEFAELLPVVGSTTSEDGSGNATDAYSAGEPVQSLQGRPRGGRSTSREGTVARPDPDGSEEPGVPGNGSRGPRRPKKKTGRRNRGKGAVALLEKLRVFKDSTRPGYALVAFFDNPGCALRSVRLVARGEDGKGMPVGLRSAKVNGKRVGVRNDAITTLRAPSGTKRCKVQFVTREPVSKKAYDISVGGERP